ncbi:MAG: 23S rRNA pseudouridine(1911/1915/1917) synthase RluD [Gammaproteobacteria bacterium]|nr:23S rRNA pseudouridine(1911/1915/1917) synthase RluD [Gammaproteobacteria bacterium]
MLEHITERREIPAELYGKRFDHVAASLFPEYSRARLQTWIKDGDLTLDGEAKKPKDKVVVARYVVLDVQLEAEADHEAEDIPLEVVYEDKHLLVVNKPKGLVVHPAAGNPSGTLLNAVLHHAPECAALPRGGIVHRLDKDTTGLMVIAKTLTAHADLVEQLHDRTVGREYEAVAMGTMTGGGKVDTQIGRHPKHRQRMAVIKTGGKQAITHYRLLKRYGNHSHIRVKLETGRTHQIRVHMAHLKHPLVGDQTYAGRQKVPAGASEEMLEMLRNFPRQALHAKALELIHPETGEEMNWEIDLPEDMKQLIELLDREDSV